MISNKLLHYFFCIFNITVSIGQIDGYWDKERATTKQIAINVRNRIIIPIEELPTGTTEIVFRITLLDENQQMANSLVSVLKAIPDPTGISQGSAGAVLLLSKIAGDDKCTYSLFTNEELALLYKDNGQIEKACYSQNEPINKDAKRLSMQSSSCLKSEKIWFGFENKNWIMNARIILEVVPWVNSRLSRGWSIENRKSILNLCKTTELAKTMQNSDNYCVCILDKVQKEYRFQEYQNLLAIEKTKLIKDYGTACFKETGGVEKVYGALRAQASELLKQNKYGESIEKSLLCISNNQATAQDYYNLGTSYLFTKQYGKAIKNLKEAEKLDNLELLIQLNLAHSYLLNGNFSQSKNIHKKYKVQNVTDSLSWIEKTRLDFETFEKLGMPTTHFDRIVEIIDN